MSTGKWLFFTILCVCVIVAHASTRTRCVAPPSFPMFGRLKFNGSITLTLTCETPGFDLPLNAPGHYGIMVCNEDVEGSEENPDFFDLRVPDCQKERRATEISTSVMLKLDIDGEGLNFPGQVVDNCESIFTSQVIPAMNTAQNLQGFTYKMDSCIETEDIGTTDNNITTSQSETTLVDVVVQVTHAFTADPAVLRSSTQNLQEAFTALDLQHVGVNSVHLEEWTTKCEAAVAAGVPLLLLKQPLCRGCSRGTFKAGPAQASCEPCPHGFKAEPFSSKCEPCPENHLSEDMKTECFSRE